MLGNVETSSFDLGDSLEIDESTTAGAYRLPRILVLYFTTLESSMTREPLVIRNPGYRRQGSNHKKVQACFVTKSVKFRFGEELLVENSTEF